VVMLTGLASEPVAVDALKAGAQDYLSKDRITAESLSMVVEKATQKVSLIRDLKAERDRLARSLAEKDVLLQEVHHRVKNNLQVIVSLLRLQANAIHDGRLAAALRESQNRVETMALIHEQLYQTRDLRQVDLARHASLLATSLLHSYGVEESRIALRVEVEPIPIAMDRAIPAGLILNELISNALKHGFPDGRRGSIVIKGVRCGDRIVLEVRDDGVGLPPTVETQQPKSLGLQIVQILSRQLKGAFEAGSGPGGVFRVIFPEGES
jgi:two-component sensor histidine kinase